ncbi:MAG: Lipopolysaccharide export system permease protein LptG [uncultured Sphingosinicella sp.]|uniref:Lipopolysaccharide export system permease protein LptG n=1 Tax=uncultured Sphingosinicella sp. TaxID=478748 RepID=A0A6J4TAY2_9SPHN|nr:LPS export ABC transporter permease LptG [uncultured Sphingosinicella sp.]CAA9517631.1 MAG: Lipopolysaccharide export system permease protein LptG [uncultured Sphingosinicella sp.]
MVNLDFFPSKRIALYMAKLFVLRSLAVLAALVVVLQTLDLLGESGKILRVAGNGDAQLWQYVALRIPQLVARFLPFSVLLGTLITLATLNQNSEVVSMKAAGISAHQIIAPLMLASLLIAALSFVFQETVVTRATAQLSAWQAVDYGPIPRESGTSNNVWVRHQDDLIFARVVSGRGAGTRLRGVTVYDRSGGTLETVIEARAARPSANGWQLEGATVFDVSTTTERSAANLIVGRGVDPTQFTLANVDPDEQDVAQLRDSIEQMEAAGRPTGPLKAGLWHKFSGPLSAVLMPLLAAVAAFGLARSGQLFLRAVIGMALGFAYFVADNFALAMGNFGAYPPLLAAWAPFVLFLLIGETVLVRTEE